jgi:hypothetical protein
MTDNELFTVVRSAIRLGLAARGLNGWSVPRKYQPHQQGANSGPSVYLSKVTDKRHGSPRQVNEWDEAAQEMRTTDVQQWETTLQVSVLVDESTDPNALTPSDAATMVCDIMQTESGLASLRALGVGVLRVGVVGNSYNVNDRNQYAADPSFDLVVTHRRSFQAVAPYAVSIVPGIDRV